MQNKKQIFIAEIKTRSPFGYQSNNSFSELMDCAIKYGDWVSVHTNALWGGDFDSISFVRRNTNKPILAKGIHGTNDDIKRAIDHGADYVLVVDRYPTSAGEQDALSTTYEKHILYEMDFQKVKQNVEFNPHWKSVNYVCNSRDLRTGQPKMKDELQDFLNLGVWTCQASGIISWRDVNPNANAFIVGENLMFYCEHL
jgi:indole-3-glycerol phosphate synthase